MQNIGIFDFSFKDDDKGAFFEFGGAIKIFRTQFSTI